MQRTLYSLAMLVAVQGILNAQESQPAPRANCPAIQIECPMDGPSYDTDQLVTFTTKVDGADSQAKLTFNWTISKGTIHRGQGTPTISVSGFGDNISVTVEVQGLPPGCSNTVSCSQVWCKITSRRFDEYGDIDEKDEIARLDNFAIELTNNPGAMAYVIGYAGRRAYANEANARLERAIEYLVKTRAIQGDRIVMMDGGYRDKLAVELFIVPVGADAPTASPTVERHDVQIIPDPPKRTKRRTGGR